MKHEIHSEGNYHAIELQVVNCSLSNLIHRVVSVDREAKIDVLWGHKFVRVFIYFTCDEIAEFMDLIKPEAVLAREPGSISVSGVRFSADEVESVVLNKGGSKINIQKSHHANQIGFGQPVGIKPKSC